MQSGILTSNSTRGHSTSAINGHPLPKQTAFGPAVCS